MAEIDLYLNAKGRTKLQIELKNNAIFSDLAILKQLSIIDNLDEKRINNDLVSHYKWKRINKVNTTIIFTFMFFIPKEDFLLQNLSENTQYGELQYPNPMGFVEYNKTNFNKIQMEKQKERMKNKKPESPAKKKEADQTFNFMKAIKQAEESIKEQEKTNDN